jgi:hypothetical protein
MLPSASRSKRDSEVYRPAWVMAWEWAPASTARVSLPVASTTALIPFMMPLLWVALVGEDPQQGTSAGDLAGAGGHPSPSPSARRP